MAINRYRFYLGPLGLMRALPPHPPGRGPEAPLRIPAADHVSLSGRTTQDRTGRIRRTWPLTWEWLSEDDETVIQAAIRRQAAGGLRLMDPRKRNLATEDISTGGGASRTTEAFSTSGAGVLTFGTGGVPLDFLGLTAGRQVWTGVTAGSKLHGTAEKTPTVSGLGSTYTVSAYVKTTTSFQFSARPFDLLGAEQATVTDATVHASTAGVWERKSWVYTPAAGVVGMYFGLTAGGAGNIETCGWSYQIDQALLPWTWGYGCPEVVISSEIPASYWRIDKHNVAILIKEV